MRKHSRRGCDEPYARLSAIIEQMQMLEGAEPPQRFGNNYDTVTAFGELQGSIVIGAQRDDHAFIEYNGRAKELGEGMIDEIWECPEGRLVTILDGQLWHAGNQLTEEGEKAHSLRRTYFGCNRQNPFALDGKFTFIKERQHPGKVTTDVWLVHGGETIPLGTKYHTCVVGKKNYLDIWDIIEQKEGKVGVKGADGGFRVLADGPMRPDTESVQTTGNMSNHVVEINPRGWCINSDVARYPNFYINDWMLRRVENVCYVAGRPAYRLMYATNKELKERLPSGGIRLHDDSVTYDTARYIAVWHQGNSISVYDKEVVGGLLEWTYANLEGAAKKQIYKASSELPVHFTKNLPNVKGFAKLLGKFSKRHLNKEQKAELEGILKG
jgi:hypothetical protein